VYVVASAVMHAPWRLP